MSDRVGLNGATHVLSQSGRNIVHAAYSPARVVSGNCSSAKLAMAVKWSFEAA